MPVEVAPIAHYHMGGVAADARMETEVPGLLRRRRGGRRRQRREPPVRQRHHRGAGVRPPRRPQRRRARRWHAAAAGGAMRRARGARPDCAPTRQRRDLNTAAMMQTLQAAMADDVGPFRTEAKLARALATIDELTRALGERPVGDGRAFDLRAARLVRPAQHAAGRAQSVAAGGARAHREPRRASARGFSRACCREWRVNQVVRLRGGALALDCAVRRRTPRWRRNERDRAR